MRIARFTAAGKEPVYGIIELAQDKGEHPDTIAAITGDPLAGMRANYTGERYPLNDVRLLAPVIPRSKVVAIGKNYVEHAHEMGSDVPGEPLVFLKPNTSVIGPGEAIVYPATSENVHYEGELAIVIGRFARNIAAANASDVIFGYTIANDVTARDLQNRDGQWSRAKGYDTFCPLGPWINTHTTIEEASNLAIETRVGDRVVQSATTSLMVYDIGRIIEFITEFTTLLPGDVVLTGTPVGVGPLAVGDVVSVSIEGLGTLTNPVVRP